MAMAPRPVADGDRKKFQQLNDVRAAALEHARSAVQLSRQRRALIAELIDTGYSQSDIAREMGVTRQAVQKMLAAG
jgi:DNA-binding NarL/FixJ family response regulator